METTWTIFKAFVQTRSLSIQWIDLDSTYWLKAMDGQFHLSCKLYKYPEDTTDLLDFENNFKSLGNKSFTDADGSIVIRPKASKRGWTYLIFPIEVKTSTLDSIYAKDPDGSNRTGITLKLYDSNNNEITTPGLLNANENTCVKTVVDFEPPYDYEMISGYLHQQSSPSANMRIWAVAVPDIAAPTGSKELVGGVNLKFIAGDDKIETDGRAAKFMQYNATYHTNKLRFIFKHDAGTKHDIMIAIELYRA